MRKTINRIAYFLDDFDTFYMIYLIFFATLLTVFTFVYNKIVSETNRTILYFVMLSVFVLIFFIYWIAKAIVNADLKKLTRKLRYNATAYTKKILHRNDDGEIYYLIKTDNETKIVKASTVLVNKQDKFANSEHKAGTMDIEYIEIELDKDLPEYKRELFTQRLTSNEEKKFKNQLNVINYVSTEV